jgi:hypothetical protein
MRPTHSRFALPLIVFVLACGGGETPDVDAPERIGEVAPRPLPDGAQAWSLLGEPLLPPELSAGARATHEANLALAEAEVTASPEDADAIIWYGRRLAYLGRYREAIAVFTRGIALHPDDARFYRHRGHRFLTVREFDHAIEDFLTAVELIRDTDDEVEPDGLPNAQGIPTSTLHFNIWYHLGLAHYLQGDLERALLAWNDCLAVSRHADSVVATSYWLNNTLRRLGLDAQADQVLASISADMDIIESTSYLDVLLLHKGEKTADELVGPMGEGATLASTTTSYGVAVWHLVNGRRDTAFGLFEEVLDNRSQWPAFGYVAAEADVARMRDGEAAN